MLVFVDESGDTGLKFGRGSSEFFTLVLVIFDTNEDAGVCDDAIAELHRESNRSREFKFSGTKDGTKRRFFECVLDHPFRYAAIVINKRKLYGKGFQHKAPFYKCAMKYVFTSVQGSLSNATVVFDSHGDRSFRNTLQSYLMREIRPAGERTRIKKVRPERSDRNNLIQLADMVCVAVARSYDVRALNADCYRNIIKEKHEVSVQFWPS